MKVVVVVTGSSCGIGRAIANEFLMHGHKVCGIDLKDGTIDSPNYKHYVADVSDEHQLPTDLRVSHCGLMYPP